MSTDLPTRASLLSASIAVGLVALSSVERPPSIIWNTTASMPVGLYVVESRDPRIGDAVALHLPPVTARLASQRGYLPDSALLLKPVAAMTADRVCRWRAHVLINGRPRAIAARQDAAHRTLPSWQGCRTIPSNHLFLLSSSIGSFDSRYFGLVRRDALVGVAIPLFTF